jgi:hypothetical protein
LPNFRNFCLKNHQLFVVSLSRVANNIEGCLNFLKFSICFCNHSCFNGLTDDHHFTYIPQWGGGVSPQKKIQENNLLGGLLKKVITNKKTGC